VAEARIEDNTAVSYHRTNTATPAHIRMRYEGRSSLKRLEALPTSDRWADGTKRFSTMK